MPGMFWRGSCALAIDATREQTINRHEQRGRSRSARRALPNDNPAVEVGCVKAVVVVVTGPNGGQRVRLFALSRREKPDRIDFETVTMLRIRASLDIVRDVVAIDEHHAAARDDRDLEWCHTARGNRHRAR